MKRIFNNLNFEIMRNFFLFNSGSKTRKLWQSFALVVGLVAFANLANAQVEMTWTGATSNNFIIEDNWDPAGSPVGNILTIPMPDTAANPGAQPFVVEVSGGDNIDVNDLTIAGASDDAYQSRLVIMMEDTATFSYRPKIKYGFTGVVVKSGTFSFTRTNAPRMDFANAWLRVEGGRAQFNNLAMSNNKNDGGAGKIYITGGEVYLYESFFREYDGYEDGQVLITGDGKLTVTGNYTPISENWINGGSEYSIARAYDAVSNITVFTAVPKSYIGIENSERQVLKNNEVTTDTLHLINTDAVANATTFEWRYRKAGEETFTSFAGGNTAQFAPSFASSGTFFVSCLVDGVATANEAEFFIVSDAISFAPAEFPFQVVRVGELGTTMTAQFTSTPTSIEWKYSAVPGGPYQSFDPAATEASFQPSFDTEGNMYVIVEAVIDGGTHASVELLYNVESASSTGKGLTWSGLVSTDAMDPANWNPVANPSKNNFYVAGLDTIDGVIPNYPVWKSEVNDTVYTFGIDPGAEATFDFGDDTLNIRGSWQEVKGGVMNVISGTYVTTSYFRMTNMGLLKLSGSSYFVAKELLYEDGKGNGGNVSVEDNAVLHCQVLPWRVVADTLESVTYIKDNGKIIYDGDVMADVSVWINSAKIVCPEEGFEPYATFDATDSITVVTARNTNAFALDNAALDFTTPNTPVATAIGLVNVDGVTSWEWKWAETVSGPWNSFEPAAVDAPTYAPMFATAGTYFVVAVTSENVQTTNMKQINVVDLSVSPADDQVIANGEMTETVTVNIPEEVVFLAGMWLLEDADGNVEETGVSDLSYATYLSNPGNYTLYYFAEVQDAEGNSYTLYSNKVNIEYGPSSVEALNMNLKLFPNPTTGTFHINTNFDSKYKVEIINLAGASVYVKEFTQGGLQTIHFNEKGAYIVKVQSGNEALYNRLLVK
jgi:hypothetical protein